MKLVLLFLLIVFSAGSKACEPTTLGETFWPNPQKNYFADLDNLKIKLVNVSRGTESSPCGDAGIITFKLDHEDSKYNKAIFSSYGFYFIAVSKDPLGVFHSLPMAAEKSKDGYYYISFPWVDASSLLNKDFEYKYKVQAISNRLSLSNTFAEGTFKIERANK
ncbi:hypothetical protein KO527_20965 [Pseudoalteromonas sp. C2R02]|uniref:hypothetical protein n=1 Tax=Pseudoalteromonas sp. C2R02 TaxID=2841565 RepID=UPI001C09E558|nr:hypothetical protein [Pseudoalteromonas sp. C2R02]MBU2971826.1 hypothetical protein [Pseudoalteromonas sp. C2R02]